MKKLFAISTLLLLAGCSASTNTTKEASEEAAPEEEVYVFDDAETKEEQEEVIYFNLPRESPPAATAYVVQLGAFTSEANAARFIKENPGINKTMNIVYDDTLGYFLVQLNEYKTREEAESVKQELLGSGLVEDIYVKKIVKN